MAPSLKTFVQCIAQAALFLMTNATIGNEIQIQIQTHLECIDLAN